MTSLSRPPEIQLPVIDFSNKDSKPGKDAPREDLESWRTTGEKVVDALKKHGCFMAKYKKLSNCHEKLFRALQVIFDLPVNTKKQNVSDIQDFAYKENHPVLRPPLYESFGIPKATTKKGIEDFIASMWPNGNDDLRKHIQAYTETAAWLEEKVIREMVFEHYKVNALAKLPEESTGYIFRMMKYKEVVRLGCSDQEFLAVLDLNQVNGLEMKTKDDKWFSIDVKPSTFLIMAGKLLTEWSKDNIRPLEHQVTKHGEKEKYSVGLFAYYDKGKIEVPKKLAGSSTTYDDKKGKDKKKPVGSSCPP